MIRCGGVFDVLGGLAIVLGVPAVANLVGLALLKPVPGRVLTPLGTRRHRPPIGGVEVSAG